MITIHVLERQSDGHIVEGNSWREPPRPRSFQSILVAHPVAVLPQLRVPAADLRMIRPEPIPVREGHQCSSFRHCQMLGVLHSNDRCKGPMQISQEHRQVVDEHLGVRHAAFYSPVAESLVHHRATDANLCAALHQLNATMRFFKGRVATKRTPSLADLVYFGEVNRHEAHGV